MKGVLKFKYPISHGVITDWDDMQLIWKHVFSELKTSTKEVINFFFLTIKKIFIILNIK